LKDTPIAVNSIGPSLGQANREAGLTAAKYGLIAVVVFMLIVYFYAGLVAAFAMLMNLLLLLAAMAALQATFTMPGIAGLILSMAMAVDANVLIYERMREEFERSQSLRLIIKNGYERALPTIIDSNMTTIITCVVLYYIGTEEIKGFGLTLGLGLVINIFSAVFATRVIFSLLIKYGILRSLHMLPLPKRFHINWLGMQRYFFIFSAILFTIGLVTYPLRGNDKYDIEFRGGTAVGIELRQPKLLTISQVRQEKEKAGQLLIDSAAAFRAAKISGDPNSQNTYTIKLAGIPAARLEAAMLSFMDDKIEKGTLQIVDANSVTFRTRAEKKLSAEAVRNLITQDVARATEMTGKELRAAQVQSVGQKDLNFEIVTTATAQRLVIESIVDTMGQYLNIQQPIGFNPDIKVYPVTKKRLGDVIGDSRAPGYVPGDYLGGVVLVVNDLKPALTLNQLRDRIAAMRLQPDFEKYQWRTSELVGLTPMVGEDITHLSQDQIRYTRVAAVVADPSISYDEDEGIWRSQLAGPETRLLQESLARTSELQKVNQFAGQVASQMKVAAILAMIVSFFAIAVYLWIRFGTLRHGVAANVAIIHDLVISIGFVMVSAYLAETVIGKWLMIEDFKINLSMVAAFLTVIGYSVNDTIVVFDRIRENQRKLRDITPQMINDSVNQTLSRTMLTGVTTLAVMFIMYVFGGEGVRGFCYVVFLGTAIGTYSSIAVASPLLVKWSSITGYDTAMSRSIAGDDKKSADANEKLVELNHAK